MERIGHASVYFSMYQRYSLTLMLTHDCNLRCSYCYMGPKGRRVMPAALGRKSIDRAVASIHDGGELQLGFFGGEPLLEPAMLRELADHARHRTKERAISLRMGITTNGTLAGPEVWDILTSPDIDITVSWDGLPEAHDRHRKYADGRGSWQAVADCIRRLVQTGREFRVISVVRPDTLDQLPDSVQLLRDLGVRQFEPSLDVWTQWTEQDEARLESMIARLADVWREGLPACSIGWFSEKAAHLAKLPMSPPTRCGFGDGAVAVAPSGHLYPCERLIGNDSPANPTRLPANAFRDDDFVRLRPPGPESQNDCAACAMEGMCNTFCRCSNHVRTGDTRRPDRLLCRWNQACLENAARVLKQLAPSQRNLLGSGASDLAKASFERVSHET